MADLAQKPPRVCAPNLQVRALNQTNTIQTTPTTQRLVTAGRAEVRHEEITDSGNHYVVHGSHDGVFHDIVGVFRSGEK